MTPAGPVGLDPREYRDLVRRALEEDAGRGDVTTRAAIDAQARGRGVFVMKSAGVVAGLDVAIEAFRQLDPQVKVTVLRPDADWCEAGDSIAEIIGNAQALLVAERTALNFLQRLSGIATLARRFVDASRGRIVVLDTRKTTPTFRALEKYAVRAGGGTNHRLSLDDGVLIKDNHIKLAGSIRAATSRVKEARLPYAIEVEVENLDEVDQALQAGADILLLDNMNTADIQEAVRRCRGRAKTEISGGVSLERMSELACTGADFVSSGALTHSAPAADISFEIEPA
jgi:nicotinate-nucleotide pyrophosphorylase (carboxylating)